MGQLGNLENQLSQIIFDANEAILEPRKWNDIVAAIAHLVHPSAAVVLLKASRPGSRVGLMQHGLQAGAASDYLNVHAASNPWTDVQRRLAIGSVYDLATLVPRPILSQSSFYSDWLEPLGPLTCGAGAVLLRWADCTVALDIMLPEEEAEASRRAIDVLQKLTPSLQRAIAMTHRMVRSESEAAVAKSALECIRVPMVVVDSEGVVLFNNGAAAAVFRSSEFLTVGDSGVIQVLNGDSHNRLHLAIRETVQTDEPVIIRISRASGRTPTLITLTMLNGTNEVNSPRIFAGEQKAVLLTIRGFDGVEGSQAGAFRAFGLTGAEAALADALVQGETLAAFAQRRGISRFTAKNQLVAILRKTGASRQVELVQMLTRLSV